MVRLMAELIPGTNLEKFDVLIATLGENPAPVVISALTLLKPGGELVLVTSPEMRELLVTGIAKVVRERLGLHRNWRPQVLVTDPNAPAVNLNLIEGLTDGKRVAADYTGGKSTMSARLCLAAITDFKSVTTCYVDGDSEKIFLEMYERDRDRITCTSAHAVEQASLEMSELLALHGAKILKSHRPNELSQFYAMFAPTTPSQRSAFTNWQKSLELSLLESQVRIPKFFAIENLIQKYLSEIAEESGGGTVQTGADLKSRLESKGLLDGKFSVIGDKWLEHFIYHTLLAQSQSNDDHAPRLSEIQMGCEPRSDVDITLNQRLDREGECEIDVVAMNGPRFVAIGATTSPSKSEGLLKLFQVASWAKGFGGGEARAALVMGLDSTTSNSELLDNLKLLKAAADRIAGNGKVKVWTIDQFGPRVIREWLK